MYLSNKPMLVSIQNNKKIAAMTFTRFKNTIWIFWSTPIVPYGLYTPQSAGLITKKARYWFPNFFFHSFSPNKTPPTLGACCLGRTPLGLAERMKPMDY